MKSPSSQLLTVLELCRAAGAAILKYYGGTVDVERKADDSPLTRADQAAHHLLTRELPAAFPDVPVLSEEAEEDAGGARFGWERFWLVDPLDGTKEFIKGTGEFTVNVALIEAGKAVRGVVYVPASGVGYLGESFGEARGAWRVLPGAHPVSIRSRRADPDQLVVVASRDHAGPRVRAMLQRPPHLQAVSMGSALKFCLVAEGTADLYLRDLPTMEWDTGAAQCVVEGAGGALLRLDDGTPLSYNKESLRNPLLVTVGDPRLDWRALVPEE